MTASTLTDSVREGTAWSFTLCGHEWRPQGEERRYIGEFEPTHRAWLYRYLMMRAPAIMFKVSLDMICGPLAPIGEMAALDAEIASEEMVAAPYGALREYTLMRALAALLIGDGYGYIVEAWDTVATDAGARRAAKFTPDHRPPSRRFAVTDDEVWR